LSGREGRTQWNAATRREALRAKGQFWTPDWVAEAMVGYVTGNGCRTVFDPAVGAGAFFRAAKMLEEEKGTRFRLSGTEIDAGTLLEARQSGLSEDDLAYVQVRDFVLDPPSVSQRAVVANPPYIRHHRLSAKMKAELRLLGKRLLGKPLDGRAGLHVYFLIQGLQILQTGGRLAFIVPADTCEGVFARALWKWIAKCYRLDGVATFSPEASPFPGIDTNPIILMLSKETPEKSFIWAKCTRYGTPELKDWASSSLQTVRSESLNASKRSVEEGIATGLSRPPRTLQNGSKILGDYARVMRGIATGANDYFLMTAERAKDLGIPSDFLIPAIGRTRDVAGEEITANDLADMKARGKATLLFSPDGRSLDEFPIAVKEYLLQGEEMGLNKRSLISTRRPWYKMETRRVPPFLFAYLGRRNARFIRNRAGVVPLTGFLCVYPRNECGEFIEGLWAILRDSGTTDNLSLIAKSYGSGALKAEPRALEQLPITAVLGHLCDSLRDVEYQPKFDGFETGVGRF